MSIENVKLFIEKISQEEALQQKMKGLSEFKPEDMMKEIVKLGTEYGCEFSATDMEEFSAEAAKQTVKDGALSDEQLEAVAGGGLLGAIAMSMATWGIFCVFSAIISNCDLTKY